MTDRLEQLKALVERATLIQDKINALSSLETNITSLTVSVTLRYSYNKILDDPLALEVFQLGRLTLLKHLEDELSSILNVVPLTNEGDANGNREALL